MFFFVRESGGVGELTAMINAVVRCHSTVNELTVCYKENEDNIKGGIKASVPASAKIARVSHHNPFLKNRETALCLQLTSETQKWLSMCCGAAGQAVIKLHSMEKKRPPLKLAEAGLETLRKSN
jgi:hypothetical protein